MDAGRGPMLARSRSGATQFEYGLDELVPQEVPAENLLHATAAEPLASSRPGLRVAVIAALALVVAGGIFFLARNGLLRPAILGPQDRLLLTEIQNKTADKTLDGAVMQGLEIALRQSESLNVLGGEAYRAGLRQLEAAGEDALVSGQAAAQKTGAKAYLEGEISGSEAPYTISVDVLKTDSNAKAISLEETAEDKTQIPAAVSRLAQKVLVRMGDSDARRGVLPELPQDVNALHAYAAGELAMQTGQIADALTAYQQAVSLDGKFVQAQMQLAWLYRSEKAEVAAANAAELARSAAEHAGDKVKLLAQFCYEVNTSGDYAKATETIRQYVAKYPQDVEGMKGLARVLRLQGYLPEALLAAQQGYGENPFDAETYAEAELAMIGMNRDDGAAQLQAQAQKTGVRRSPGILPVEAPEEGLSNNASGATPPPQISYAELTQRALALDNAGRMSEGMALWRTTAEKAGKTTELTSAQTYMLAQAALDHALAEDCTVVRQMVNEVKDLPKGPPRASMQRWRQRCAEIVPTPIRPSPGCEDASRKTRW